MERKRKPSIGEIRLIDFLIERSGLKLPVNWKDTISVEAMNDDGMGSLKLLMDDKTSHSIFGKKVSECFFKDEDGIQVIASLNIDSNNQFLELDIWKTDFSALISIPQELE